MLRTNSEICVNLKMSFRSKRSQACSKTGVNLPRRGMEKHMKDAERRMKDAVKDIVKHMKDAERRWMRKTRF